MHGTLAKACFSSKNDMRYCVFQSNELGPFRTVICRLFVHARKCSVLTVSLFLVFSVVRWLHAMFAEHHQGGAIWKTFVAGRHPFSASLRKRDRALSTPKKCMVLVGIANSQNVSMLNVSFCIPSNRIPAVVLWTLTHRPTEHEQTCRAPWLPAGKKTHHDSSTDRSSRTNNENATIECTSKTKVSARTNDPNVNTPPPHPNPTPAHPAPKGRSLPKIRSALQNRSQKILKPRTSKDSRPLF